MVGSAILRKLHSSGFTNIIFKTSKELDLTNQLAVKDFFSKEIQETSNEGGFRQATIKCEGFSIMEPFVSFTLSRGSYATILLREIMKPSDPIVAGF